MDMNDRVYIQHKAFCLSSSFWLRCPLFILGTPIIVTEKHCLPCAARVEGGRRGQRGRERRRERE